MNTTMTYRRAATAWLRALTLLLAAAAPFTASVFAQSVNFAKPSAVRVTVPVNTTNTTIITNIVNIADVTSDVVLDISGLPAGAGYALSTNNLQTNADLTITIYTTNITQGEYTFSLNGTGGATNNLLFILQSGYVWGGAGQNVAANWTNNTSWIGGSNPTNNPAADVIFGTEGAQTNRFANLVSFTNAMLDQNVSVGSIRFSQGVFTNSETTNTVFHHLRLANNTTLTVNGSKGFRVLRDYLTDYAEVFQRTGVFISGGNGARLNVSNMTADFALLLDGGNASGLSFLSLSNLHNFSAAVNRFGLGEYQLYPNYFNYVDTNGFEGGVPRRFGTTMILARTNIVIAGYKNPDNYTNQATRAYAISYMNSERFGTAALDYVVRLGQTNRFLADAICMVGANHQGLVQFNAAFSNPGAVFRGTNGTATSRMSLFALADDGGTDEASSNTKATVDFAGNNGFVDILADKLIIARDRTLISSNQSPNVVGDLTIGRGIVDVNTMILGFQEHDGKTNWTAIGGAQPYLNWCQGRLIITNGGTVRVGGLLTLGYTADSNPTAVAQQYNTHGQVTVLAGSTMIASNIVVDGGPFNYDPDLYGTPRTDFITVNTATLIVTNSVGAAPGRALNSLSLNTATNVIFVDPSRTNFVVKTLLTSGSIPSVLKVASLTGVSSFPAQIPVIAYTTAASPFLAADVTSVTNSYPGLQGYVLNNTANNTIDLYLTTNAPKTLLWTGSVDDKWNNTTFNWINVSGGGATNFSIGDVVIFNDSSTRTNVDVVEQVVPNQAVIGVTVSNTVREYTFSGAGAITGTGVLLKQGLGRLNLNSPKEGGVQVSEGTVSGSGTIGTPTVYSNAIVNFSGTINGGLVSTGSVILASGSAVNGALNIQGGFVDNSGTISTAPGSITWANVENTALTNQASGVMNVSGTSGWSVPGFGTLANFGSIMNLQNGGNVTVNGLAFGNGTFADPDGGLVTTINARVIVGTPDGVLSPGASPTNSIGTMLMNNRFDLNVTENGGRGTLLIEVNKANAAQTNDVLMVDHWNNIVGRLIMANLNPGAPFANGDSFLVFSNNNGSTFENKIDVDGVYPFMEPTVPRPGLQWGLEGIRSNGIVSVTQTPMVWQGNTDGNWNLTTVNWQSGDGKYTNNAGAMFDDSATGTKDVILNGLLAPCGYDKTTNIVVGVSTNIFTNSLVMAPGIVVSNSSTYTFSGSGSIDGWTGLYKTGPGTLVLGSVTNRYTGNTIIDQGTVEVAIFTNNGVQSPLGAPGATGRQPRTSERLVIGGATLKFTGNTMSSDRGFTIESAGATLNVSNSAATLALIPNGTIVGRGALTKTGAGRLILGQGNNSFTNLIINEGNVLLSAAAAGRGHLTLNGGSLALSNSVSMTNLINVAVSTTLANTNASILSGSLTGAGDLAVQTFSPSTIVWSGRMSNYSGTLSFGTSTGTNRFNNTTNSSNARGSSLALFDLGTGSLRLENLSGGGLTYDLGGLAGGPNTVLAGRSTNNVITNAESTYVIGAKGVDTTFSGTIVDGVSGGTVSVVKVGAGKLTLNGVNTYTGPTTVSNGTLAGSATFAGSLSVVAGATLAPGSSVGTMTVNSNVTLAGTTLMELDRISGVSTNDKLVANAITPGGSLVVTNIGPTIFNGATFQLFSVPVSGFSSVTLPGAPYVWQTNLAVNGSITLVSGGTLNTNPTTIASSVSGSTLTLSWPSSHIGWELHVQTNSRAVGITSSNWFVIPGSTTTNSVNVTINPADPTVFLRLVLP